ncbi:hypothetical protein EXY28_25190 [Burkholderia pseudomallei]|nr:hypothetical protein EXY28_25190 [Burkholderia pseudomallei]QBP64690.1 hypothetical protein E2R29_24920 [Burkholderia pseudomallei]
MHLASGFRRIRTPPTSAPVPRAAPAPNISVCFQLFRIVVGDPRAEKPWQSTVQSGCPFAQPICKVSR